VAGHARVFLEQARKMVDTKPRAGGQILDRETLGAVVVDVGAQLCKAAHVVLLLGVIQHLLALPLGSVSSAFRLLVPMNEAIRGRWL